MLAKRTELRPLPSLRRMVSAGEPLNPEVIEAFREATGLEIADGYGQTETGQVTGNLAGEPVRAGLDGQAAAGLRDRGSSTGELQLRAATCPTFFSALPRRRAASRASGGRPATWSARDEDGYLFFEGRDDDMILSAGYRIGPFEVESALVSHPAVAEAAAVAAPDPERGSVVRAIVVLRDARALRRARRASCRSTARRQTAPYKFPRIVEFADELPKTTSGKIKRAELRRRSLGHGRNREPDLTPPPSPAPTSRPCQARPRGDGRLWEPGSPDVFARRSSS